MATIGGEWCGPTRELKNSQLIPLVHKSRKIVSENLRVDVEVTPSDRDEVVLLVNKPPDEAAVIGVKVDALPEAVVLDLERIVMEPVDRPFVDPPQLLIVDEPSVVTRARLGSGSAYPMHRDTLRPLRLVLLLIVIAAGVAAAAIIV